MWCAATATVHFSAPVVFFQSASFRFSRRAVASATLASNCLASASALAPIISSLVCAYTTLTSDYQYRAPRRQHVAFTATFLLVLGSRDQFVEVSVKSLE